jgi:hypothetical protein
MELSRPIELSINNDNIAIYSVTLKSGDTWNENPHHYDFFYDSEFNLFTFSVFLYKYIYKYIHKYCLYAARARTKKL